MLTEEQKALAGDNIRLIYSFIAKNCSRYKRQSERDEIESVMHLAIVRAAKAFDPDKGYKFSTFVYACCVNGFREWLRERKQKPRITANPDRFYLDGRTPVFFIAGEFSSEFDHWQTGVRGEVNATIKEVLPDLSDRETKVLGLRLDGVTLREIAKELGVTKSRAGQITDIIREKAKRVYRRKVGLGVL